MNKPQTGIRFRSEMLGCSHIQRLAEYVAAEYGLPRVDRKHVRRMYAQATPIPITLENENGQVFPRRVFHVFRAAVQRDGEYLAPRQPQPIARGFQQAESCHAAAQIVHHAGRKAAAEHGNRFVKPLLHRRRFQRQRRIQQGAAQRH